VKALPIILVCFFGRKLLCENFICGKTTLKRLMFGCLFFIVERAWRFANWFWKTQVSELMFDWLLFIAERV
jgi:hypothetical protein